MHERIYQSRDRTPIDWSRNSKRRPTRSLVKRSALWSLVGMNSEVNIPSSISLWMKRWQISMCFVWECWTGFLEILIARIVIIDGQMFLTNTIIEHEFLNLEKLSAATSRSNVFNFNNRKRDKILLLTPRRN